MIAWAIARPPPPQPTASSGDAVVAWASEVDGYGIGIEVTVTATDGPDGAELLVEAVGTVPEQGDSSTGQDVLPAETARCESLRC